MPNSYGVLFYKDSKWNKCIDEGNFTDQLHLTGIGKRSEDSTTGDNSNQVIGNFSHGTFINGITLKKSNKGKIVKKIYFHIQNNAERR